MLKRYIVFVPDGHDAQGGWNDLLCESEDDGRPVVGMGKPLSYDAVEEAVQAAIPVLKGVLMSCEASYHVVDLQTGTIVAYAPR